MALKTQRTNLYYSDPADDMVVEVGCVTSVSGIGASRDQLDSTCLSDDARSFEAGLGTPGAATFTINFDPADASHLALYALWKAGTVLHWALGLGDGPAAPAALVPPTGASDGGFELPTTRSFVTFEGYIQDVPLDLALNAFITAQVSIQVSDFPVLVPKA